MDCEREKTRTSGGLSEQARGLASRTMIITRNTTVAEAWRVEDFRQALHNAEPEPVDEPRMEPCRAITTDRATPVLMKLLPMFGLTE